MDWLLTLAGSSVGGVVGSTYAFARGLPIELSGMIAFTCVALVLIGRQIKRRVEAQEIAPVGINTYLTAYETIDYLAHDSQWGVDKTSALSPDGLHYNVLLEAPSEFRARASEGRVTVFGASSETGQHEEIQRTFWMSNGLEHSTIYYSDAVSKTGPATFQAAFFHEGGGSMYYSDLKIVEQHVYRTWPRRTDK